MRDLVGAWALDACDPAEAAATESHLGECAGYRWASLVHTLTTRITYDRAAAAEDITQDVFLRLWQEPDRYQPDRGSLRSWLCMLARGRALDWVRRRDARVRYQLAAATRTAAVAQPDIDDGLMWRTEAKIVREAVQGLPADQRDAAQLAYYQGHTYRQVAALLKIP